MKKYKLGELIELSVEKNSEGLYGIENVRGISNAKEIMSTKADVDENVIRNFLNEKDVSKENRDNYINFVLE